MRHALLTAALAALILAPTAEGSFTQEPGSPFAVGGNNPYGILTADFNGDGRPDVATVNGSSSDVSVFLRQAPAGFAQEGTATPIGLGPNFGTVADFNRDGRPDIAAGSWLGEDFRLLLRSPVGGFSVQTTAAGHRVGATAAGDFDRDNDVDIVVSNWDGAQVRVWLRQGPGGPFVLGPDAPTGAAPRYIATADFNRDGRVDLAVASINDGNVTILLGKDGGGFEQEGNRIQVGVAGPTQGAAGIAPGDFNGDGRTDFAVANYGANTVSVLLRQAAGFVEASGSPVKVGSHPVGIAAADFNRDGLSDFAVANNASNSVSVMLRTASGFVNDVSSPVPSDGNGGAYAVAVADFDADTRPDLAVSNDQSSKVTILLNTTPFPPGPPPPPPPPPPPGAVDADRDGVSPPLDCDDANPGIRPGARDVPRNGVDEDCVGGDARLPLIKRRITAVTATYPSGYLVFTSMSVKPARKGDRMRLTCKGPGCDFKKKAVRVKKNAGKRSLMEYVRGMELRKGAVVQLRITRPKTIGRVRTWTVRAPKIPRITDRCVAPGAKKLRRCPRG
jgi:hypothetical protein